MRKLKNTTIVRNDGALLSGLQCNALASLVHFVVYKVNYTVGCKCIASRVSMGFHLLQEVANKAALLILTCHVRVY